MRTFETQILFRNSYLLLKRVLLKREALFEHFTRNEVKNFCNFAKGMSIEIKNFIRTISEIFNLAQG